MKVSLSLALLGASSAALAKVDLSSIKRVTNLGTVPNKFIVEVKAASDIPSKRDGTVRFIYFSFRKMQTDDVFLSSPTRASTTLCGNARSALTSIMNTMLLVCLLARL
jgi:hypothetical protein